MAKTKAHVSKEKKQVVKKLKDLLKAYPIIAAVNMENLPAQQLQVMKKKLSSRVVIFMAKRRLIKIAIEEMKAEKKGIEELEPYLKGMPALLFTKDNPFSLYKILKQNKSKAPAKAGQTAPSDIIIKAGATNFLPGPIIGELGALGIKSKVDAGKIAIVADKVIVEEGGEIKPNVASLLLRLGIKPMEIGLDLTACYEGGIIFTKKVLDVDEKQFLDNITQCSTWSINLAMDAGIYTDMTTEMMVIKAQRESRGLSVESGFMTAETTEDILAKANMIAAGVKLELKI